MLIDEKYKHKKVWYDDLAERAKGKLTLSLQTMLGQVDRKREELMSACKNDGTEEQCSKKYETLVLPSSSVFSHLYYRCLNVNLSGYGVQDQDEIRSMVADVTKGCEDVIVNMLAEEYEKKIPVMYREMHKMTL